MQVINNKKLFRFEIALPEGEYATLEYRWLKGRIVLMHTIVPAPARGKGVGGELVKFVMEHIREQGLKIIVYCPFVAAWLKTHKGYDDLAG